MQIRTVSLFLGSRTIPFIFQESFTHSTSVYRFFIFFRYFIRDIKAKGTGPTLKELMEIDKPNASNVRKSHFPLSALIEAHIVL